MSNRIRSIPVAFTALYTTLVVVVLSNNAARAADDCLAAPNSQPPQGSHWYYHIDGATLRHCWYLGPEGQKIHHAEPEVLPAAKSTAPPRAETTGDRPMATARVAQPPQLPSPATAAYAFAQASDQEAVQGARQGTSFIARWPDQQQLAGAGGREPLGARTIQDVSAADEAVRPAASTPNARTITLTRVVLLVAIALAVAGIFQHTIFRIVGGRRRRRIYVERGRAERSVSPAPARMPPAFAASRPSGPKRVPIEQIGPQDIRHILRALEHQAA